MPTTTSKATAYAHLADKYSSFKYKIQDSSYHSKTPLEQIPMAIELAAALPDEISEALRMLMFVFSITPKELAEELMMNDRTVYRLFDGTKQKYDADTITYLCVAMHIPPPVSKKLLKLARITLLDTSVEDMTLKMVLSSMYMSSFCEVRQQLNDIKYSRIRKWNRDIGDAQCLH